jgi:hypothetical protein
MNDNEVRIGGVPQDIIRAVLSILTEAGLLLNSDIAGDDCCWQPFTGDGSNRRFWRLVLGDSVSTVVVAPAGRDESGMREAHAAWHIGKHLSACGAPVPKIYGYDSTTGVLVYEDLGSTKLHDLASTADLLGRKSQGRLLVHYRQVLTALAAMQYQGAVGFDSNWCCDTARYDKALMLERESGYFLKSFWQDMLGKQVPDGIEAEFRLLADRASEADDHYFLYRDFQSRNIMIHRGEVRFIDYQGGRFGPLGYDLASLLIDPYVQLPQALQAELYDFYLKEIARFIKVDESKFFRIFQSLCLQRNLQIVGAFAYLSRVRAKTFFADYITPALLSLQTRLNNHECPEYSILGKMVDESISLAHLWTETN